MVLEFSWHKITICLVGLIFSPIMQAASEMTLRNLTPESLHLSTQVSGGLSPKAWKQKFRTLNAGNQKVVLEFNRDSGVKRNKRYLLTTKIQDHNNCSIDIFHYLRGKMIGSYMSQGARGNVIAEPFFTSNHRKYKTFSLCNENGNATLSNASYVMSVDYRVVKRLGNNDLEVIVQSYPFASQDIGAGSVEVDILSYNIFMRPITLFKNDQWERMRKIPSLIKDIDLVMLVEAFDDSIRKHIIKKSESTHPYASKVLGTDRFIKQDGGVVALSKYPIIFEQELLFGSVCRKVFEDCLSDKGALMVAFLKEGKVFFVLGTHLEAGGHRNDVRVRLKQLHLINNFVKNMKIPQEIPSFLSGDFNIDLNSEEYPHLTSVLNAFNGAQEYQLPTVDAQNTYNEAGSPTQTLDYILWNNDNKWPVSFEYSVTQPAVCTATLLCNKKDISDHYPVLGRFIFSWN